MKILVCAFGRMQLSFSSRGQRLRGAAQRVFVAWEVGREQERSWLWWDGEAYWASRWRGGLRFGCSWLGLRGDWRLRGGLGWVHVPQGKVSGCALGHVSI